MIETWFWCPYLCFRAWEIEWEQFWNRPINRVATFGITGLPDHLLTHKQVPRRWFLAWLNAAQLVRHFIHFPWNTNWFHLIIVHAQYKSLKYINNPWSWEIPEISRFFEVQGSKLLISPDFKTKVYILSQIILV